jgi:hypothetical protein
MDVVLQLRAGRPPTLQLGMGLRYYVVPAGTITSGKGDHGGFFFSLEAKEAKNENHARR